MVHKSQSLYLASKMLKGVICDISALELYSKKNKAKLSQNELENC